MATTGGGSALRGTAHGEFDHIVWSTMEADGPHITNLLLDGIMPANVVTEQGITRFRDFLRKAKITVAPVLIDDVSGFSQGQIDPRLINDFDVPIELSGQFAGIPLRGLSLAPAQLTLKADAGQSVRQNVIIKFEEHIAFAQLSRTSMTATLTTGGSGPRLAAERTIPVIIGQRHVVPIAVATIIVDGRTDEWKKLGFSSDENPLVLETSELWQGAGDASFTFDLLGDESFIYLAVHVTDDAVFPGADSIELRLDTRPIATRATDRRLRKGIFRVRSGAPNAEG